MNSRRHTSRTPRRNCGAAARFARGNHRRRGVVMVMVLLATLLLAGLVFYVFNLGRHVNDRVVTQHSADAAAMAGSGWVARSFNTVAMNNTAMARLLSAAQVLDAAPEAIAFTYEDQTALRDAISQQRSRPTGETHPRLSEELANALEQIAEEVDREIALIEPVHELLNVPASTSYFDVRRVTTYDGPDGRGRIWQAMESLDAFSQTAMETMGVLAQLNAVRGGEINLQDPDGTAMLLPLVATPPVRRGQFADFQRPMRQGLLPQGVDNIVTNRGPYDAIYGWRDIRYRGGTRGRGGSPGVGYSGPLPGIGRGDSGTPGVGGTRGEPIGYRVYGPLQQMQRHIARLSQSRHGRFAGHFNQHVNFKVRYLWNSAGPSHVINPQWMIDYDQSVDFARAGASRIHNTRFVAIEIKSRYPREDSRFLSAGSWAHVGRGNNRSPRTLYLGRWVDPATWDNVPKISDHIWRSTWDYQIPVDPQIGIQREVDINGDPVTQPVYRYDYFIFAGINIGTREIVHNPNNFASRDDLPAPIDLAHEMISPDDPAAKQHHLTFMAVAQRGDKAALWPERFASGKPAPGMVATAQAHVFNDHSWDLWTQMWQPQIKELTPQAYSYWVARLDATAGDLSLLPMLSPQRVDSLDQYLRSIEPLADVMLSH